MLVVNAFHNRKSSFNTTLEREVQFTIHREAEGNIKNNLIKENFKQKFRQKFKQKFKGKFKENLNKNLKNFTK